MERSRRHGWAVLVSEVMLQQTPVARVLPAYEAWMRRWPTPSALADETAGEAVRMWGRLGYPRRALRLHAAAVTIEAEYDGIVPSDYAALRSLPGIGETPQLRCQPSPFACAMSYSTPTCAESCHEWSAGSSSRPRI